MAGGGGMSKVMISLPDEFLKAVDAAAKAEHRTRSELIREAIRTYFQEERRYKRPIDSPTVRKAYDYIISHPICWSGKFDSTQVIRKMRDTRYGAKSSK